jgi:hypothetical protein
MKVPKHLSLLGLFLIFYFLCGAASVVQTHKVYVTAACGFAGDVKEEYDCADDASPKLENVVFRMIAFNGFKGSGIRIEDCKAVQYPVTARNRNGTVEIIVDASKLGQLPNWYLASILAHELGHIYDGHIYDVQCVSKKHELDADYYAGFWAHRANCPKVDLVIEPFLTVPPDDTHPDSAERIRSVRLGWSDEEKPYPVETGVTATGPAKDADTYGKYTDLFVTVTPYVLRRFLHRSHNDFKVKIHLASTDIRLPVDSLVSRILKVTYSFDEEHITDDLVVSRNQYQDNFGYLITGVWNAFPVKCVVYFKDNSMLMMTKEFKLN